MGIFQKFIDGLKKTKDAIRNKISELVLGGAKLDEFMDDLEGILISSDISVNLASDIIEELRETAKEERIHDVEYITKLLRNQLIERLESAPSLTFETPAVIMVVGVNGVGKTTTIGKLANYFSVQGKNVVIAAADTFRAAAADQLSVWADRAKVRIVKQAEGSDPSAVVFDAVHSAKARENDVLIIDTAGRLHNKAHLMEELKKMDRVVKREYPEANYAKLIVLDATTGQNAISQVEYFDDAVGIDGIVVTKLDGTAKGGAVMSIVDELELPICFVGLGEKIDDLQEFDAEDFVNAIL